MVALGLLASSSPPSSPGAWPDASCHGEPAAASAFLRLSLPLAAGSSSVTALLSPTISHEAPPPAGRLTGSGGAGARSTGAAAGAADAGAGAGVHTGSAGAGVHD